uniref:Uncharacterized protein n=1 Tax=Rhizophora mucronata TaxID=61149 RepID=A0A2P2N2S3_RHIMU
MIKHRMGNICKKSYGHAGAINWGKKSMYSVGKT